MSQSPEFKSRHLSLPFIAPAQAQKHVTHNEALRMVDSLLQISVNAVDAATPPSTPTPGARYIIGAEAGGDWTDKDGQLAAFEDGAWAFYPPQAGWIIWDKTEGALRVFDGTEWRAVEGTGSSEPTVPPTGAAQWGVNTAADDTNRLSVKSDAVLLSHDDVTPGSGDIQIKLNKQNAANTGSFLWQTNYSGRAEIGTNGDDALSVKVSADGTDWKTALRIDGESGAVSLPLTPAPAQIVNILPDGGRFAGVPEQNGLLASAFVVPNYFSSRNQSVMSEGPKFIHNNTTFGGSRGVLDPDIEALMIRLRTNPWLRRNGVEFFTTLVTSGDGTVGSSLSADGIDHYLALYNPIVPLPSRFTMTLHMRVRVGSVMLRMADNADVYIDGVLMSADTRVAVSDGWKQVSWLYWFDIGSEENYSSSLHRLYAALGTQWLFALPFYTSGHLPQDTGLIYDVTPSASVWT